VKTSSAVPDHQQKNGFVIVFVYDVNMLYPFTCIASEMDYAASVAGRVSDTNLILLCIS
jgi:hypothetical protein